MDANSLGLSSWGLGADTPGLGTDASVFMLHTLTLPPAAVKLFKPDLELNKHTDDLNNHSLKLYKNTFALKKNINELNHHANDIKTLKYAHYKHNSE
jgi:hypothetical protein